jgi:hypothetical protein
MSSQESQPLGIQLLHVDEVALREVLDDLDAQPHDARAAKRKYERHPYRNRKVILCTRSSQRNVAFLVHARNISIGGISLVHGQMLYPRQRCSVGLPAQPGKWLMAHGQVVRCRHVSGMLHEVGIEFLRPLDPLTLQQLRDAAPAPVPPSEGKAWMTLPA